MLARVNLKHVYMYMESPVYTRCKHRFPAHFEFLYLHAWHQSMSMSQPGQLPMSRPYAAARRGTARHTVEVPQNDVQMVSWPPETQVRFLVTGHLNSCTAVAIISPKAAILAHIAPLPNDTTNDHLRANPRLGEQHVTYMMQRLAALYSGNLSKFERRETYIVAGIYSNRPSMESGIQIINNGLRILGLRPDWKQYDVLPSPQRQTWDQTSVVIFAETLGEMPRVTINNMVVR